MLKQAGLCGVLLPLLFVAPRDEVALQFCPRVGTQLAKDFRFEAELREWTLEVNGSEFISSRDLDLRLLARTQFTDRYLQVGGGRPLEFVRTCGDMNAAWVYSGQRTEIAGFDALSDRAVRFTWRPDPQCFARAFESKKTARIDLDDLVEDLDLRGFLPQDPVKPADKWTARGRPVMDALTGFMEMGLQGISADQTDEALLRDVFLRPLRDYGDKQVEIDCVYVGEEDSMSPAGAKVRLQIFGRYQMDVTSEVNRVLESWNAGQWDLRVNNFLVVWKLDGHGKLIWNVAEQRFESLDLKTAFELDCTFELPDPSATQGRSDMSVRFAIKGTLLWAMSAERVP